MRKIKGKDLLIFLDTSEDTTAIAESVECDLLVSEESIGTMTSECWQWQSSVSCRSSWSASTEAYATSQVNPLSLVGKKIKLTFGTAPDIDLHGLRNPDGNIKRMGEAYVTDVMETADLRGIAKYRIKFTGSGILEVAIPAIHGALWYDYDNWYDYEDWIDEASRTY